MHVLNAENSILRSNKKIDNVMKSNTSSEGKLSKSN